ncbi:4-hydroxy-4-methyl-2-oxoglutarate aldolase [Aliidongia dinghuensis]|uniref:Putative 4-hydroxy-4-methyl-2-oxoglutarate aldolase n=1 Tax=Aliidongia dinghuensis TaxID=1867774 RepID=A0A8J2Z1M5_9PROT|nr:RraA family protein [Aliidongia dinghuensis]GGF50288.1 4-hydroxy-4-methyl-2-oxoglutarate aldolase [Aliidongia dinghuensis]
MASDVEMAEVLELLAAVETATIGHVRSEGFMAPAMQCLVEGPRIAGRALTVSLPGDDGAALLKAVAEARPGDILVVARPGDDRHACWGAVMTAAAEAAGLAGVVIDGYVTDVGAIRASGLPVWCLGRSPVTTKNRGGGAVGVPVTCGGVPVHPGDVVLADENGVLVMAPDEAHALAVEALAIQAAEPRIIERVRAGETLAAIYAERDR